MPNHTQASIKGEIGSSIASVSIEECRDMANSEG